MFNKHRRLPDDLPPHPPTHEATAVRQGIYQHSQRSEAPENLRTVYINEHRVVLAGLLSALALITGYMASVEHNNRQVLDQAVAQSFEERHNRQLAVDEMLKQCGGWVVPQLRTEEYDEPPDMLYQPNCDYESQREFLDSTMGSVSSVDFPEHNTKQQAADISMLFSVPVTEALAIVAFGRIKNRNKNR